MRGGKLGIAARFIAAALIGGLAAGAAGAEPSSARPESKLASDEDVNDGLFVGVLSKNPGPSIERINGLLATTDDRSQRAFLLALRGAGQLGIGNIASANRDFAEAKRNGDGNLLVDRLHFTAALAHRRFDQAAIAMDRLLAGPADYVLNIDRDYVSYYLATEQVPKAKLDDHLIGLAKINYGGDDFIYTRLKTARILVARGQISEARTLVPSLDQVEVAQRALIDRQLEALWPDFERLVGPRMAAMAARNVADAEADFAKDPSDADRRRRLMAAYSAAGRKADAIARGAEFARTSVELAALDQPGGWVVNEHALALFAIGKRAEADRRFAELIAANSAKDWIINMVINRLELLAQVGNHSAADALMAYTEANGQSFASPYAKQLIQRMKLCTAIGLKRSEQVPALLADVRAHAKDSLSATVEGLMCAGDLAGAEKLAIEGLANEDSRGAIVMQMQKTPLDPGDPSLWTTGWSELRQRPAVEAAFQKAGRDLPDLYRVK